MSNFVDEIAAQFKETILSAVLPQVQKRIESVAKETFVFCYTEEEAAEKLKCSPQTLARKRKDGEIDYSYSASGRPVYMPHHLLGYLKRQERRNGKQEVTLNDVLSGGNVLDFPVKKAS